MVRSSRVIPTWDGRTARLEIENLELEDAGLYTCVAENEVGRTRCSARLVVLEKDDPSQEDTRPPVFLHELPAEVVATDGDVLDLQVRLEGGCTAESHSVYCRESFGVLYVSKCAGILLKINFNLLMSFHFILKFLPVLPKLLELYKSLRCQRTSMFVTFRRSQLVALLFVLCSLCCVVCLCRQKIDLRTWQR